MSSRAPLVILLLVAACGDPAADAQAGAKGADAKPATPDAKGADAKPSEPDVKPADAKPATPDASSRKTLSAEHAKQLRKTFRTKLDEGRAKTKAGQYRDGIALYDEALAIEPSNPAALAELGWAAFQAEQLELAQGATTRALLYSRKSEQQGMILYNLGRIAEARGDDAAALAHYRDSLARRDNETVKKHLDALLAKAELAPARPGLARIAERAASLDAACSDLVRDRCDDVFTFDGQCACSVAQGDEASGYALVQLGEAGAAENAVWFPALRTSAGWTVFEAVAWLYNPGAFGIFEEGKWAEPETRDLLPGGDPEWVLRFEKSRSDSDMGLNEFETEDLALTLVCAREGEQAWCTEPLLLASSYSREVEFLDGDGEGEDAIVHEGLPKSMKFSCTIELGEQVVISNVVGIDDAQTGWIANLDARPAGSYPLVELLGRTTTP
jgi:tetratricopeptide (TPR) repeat protein